MWLQASLGSYLSAKTNKKVIRRSYQNLRSQKWVNGDFFNSILPELVSLYRGLGASKIVFLWLYCLPLNGMKKFSARRHYLMSVFGSFLRIISFRQIKRKCHTTLQSESAIANVSRWLFFQFHTPSEPVSLWSGMGTWKFVFQWTCCFTLGGVKKFSVGHHCLTCVLVSFLRTRSIRGNKREHHTTSQKDFNVANVSRCWFFKFHTHSDVIFVGIVLRPSKNDEKLMKHWTLKGDKKFFRRRMIPIKVRKIFSKC